MKAIKIMAVYCCLGASLQAATVYSYFVDADDQNLGGTPVTVTINQLEIDQGTNANITDRSLKKSNGEDSEVKFSLTSTAATGPSGGGAHNNITLSSAQQPFFASMGSKIKESIGSNWTSVATGNMFTMQFSNLGVGHYTMRVLVGRTNNVGYLGNDETWTLRTEGLGNVSVAIDDPNRGTVNATTRSISGVSPNGNDTPVMMTWGFDVTNPGKTVSLTALGGGFNAIRLDHEVTSIPEPSAIGLLAGAGLFGLVGLRRRK